MYRSGNVCELAPYFPSQFARQFGYDQLYVHNPYKGLTHCNSLINGPRTWRYFVIFSTSVTFQMPTKDPPLLTTLAFCWWYSESNKIEPEYDLYYTRLPVFIGIMPKCCQAQALKDHRV